MPDIVKELNLNKHPKNCKDLSLIYAKNVRVSNDLSCLQSEESILKHDDLMNKLTHKTIVGYIPCNKEIVFVTIDGNKPVIGTKINAYLERYNELENRCECVYTKYKYYGGEIKGTFTYNINDELILAISEFDYDNNLNLPLHTINIGKWDGEVVDGALDYEDLTTNPKVRIPEVTNYQYVAGTAYKGWYHFFIRFKINNRDYTKWFPLGFPILIDEVFKSAVVKYFQPYDDINSTARKANERDERIDTVFGGDAYVDTSSKYDICSKTVNLNINFNSQDNKSIYQIGFICTTKKYTKAFKTSDIELSDRQTNFIVNFNILDEYSVEEFLLQNFNYYNVKNIINYKNKLYIANYKDSLFDYETLSQFVRNNIQINLTTGASSAEQDSYDTEYETEIEEPASVAGYRLIVDVTVFATRVSDGVEIAYRNFKADLLNSKILAKDYPQGVYPENADSYWDYEDYTDFRIESTFTLYDENNQETQLGGDIDITGGTQSFNSSAGYYPPLIGLADYKDYYTTPANELRWQTSRGVSTQYTLTINGTVKNIQLDCFFVKTGDKIAQGIGWGLKYLKKIDYGSYYSSSTDYVVVEQNTYKPISQNTNTNTTITPSADSNYDFNFLRNATLIPGETYKIYIHFVNDYGEISDGIFISDINVPKNTTVGELYRISAVVNALPTNCVGYFLSYEKLQKKKSYSGLLVYENNIYKFFSGEVDIFDSIDLQGNKANILGTVSIDDLVGKGIGQSGIAIDLSIFENKYYFWNKVVDNANYNYLGSMDIKSIELIAADDFSKGNNGKGSYLKLNFSSGFGLTPGQYYICDIYNDNSGQYKNEIKTLIKFTNVIYSTGSRTFNNGYSGRITKNDILIYNKNGFVLDSSINTLYTNDFYPYYSSYIIEESGNARFKRNYFQREHNPSIDLSPNPMLQGNNVVPAPLVVVSLYEYSDIILETKQINNAPQKYPLNTTVPRGDEDYATPTFVINTITEPKNSVDLFEEVNGSQDFLNPQTWVNYDKNTEYQNEFNKRIQRSNVIQDESIENSWRFFPVEGYKDITENKGVITNLVAIGTTMLAHTEHSLFMFDRDNTLQTNDKQVQLAMPDIFDVDYKEVFTSELGIAGLQDSKAYIVDVFGYIFYDNDSHQLYRFGEKQLNILDFNLIQFLFKYRPYKVRFANDKNADRILLNIHYMDGGNSKEITLSFNTSINKSISLHTYNFEESTNTKNNVYLFKNLKNNPTNIYYINNDFNNGNRNRVNDTNNNYLKNIEYNRFENNYGSFGVQEFSQIDIIINNAYEVIKYLEFITYKLYEVTEVENNDNVFFPVEEMRVPYAGTQIRVYNGSNSADRVDTGWIDIKNANWQNKNNSQKPMEYKLPYWHNGNWNFNYLRDKLNHGDSRLWGNYFIVSIRFGRENVRTEFETLGYAISKSEQ